MTINDINRLARRITALAKEAGIDPDKLIYEAYDEAKPAPDGTLSQLHAALDELACASDEFRGLINEDFETRLTARDPLHAPDRPSSTDAR